VQQDSFLVVPAYPTPRKQPGMLTFPCAAEPLVMSVRIAFSELTFNRHCAVTGGSDPAAQSAQRNRDPLSDARLGSRRVCLLIVGGKLGWVGFGKEACPFSGPEVQLSGATAGLPAVRVDTLVIPLRCSAAAVTSFWKPLRLNAPDIAAVAAAFHGCCPLDQ
jgi:hypothetical protein